MQHVRSGIFCSRFFGGAAADEKDFIDFNNTAQLFAHRTNTEIARAVLVLQLCSIDSFVNRSLQASRTHF